MLMILGLQKQPICSFKGSECCLLANIGFQKWPKFKNKLNSKLQNTKMAIFGIPKYDFTCEWQTKWWEKILQFLQSINDLTRWCERHTDHCLDQLSVAHVYYGIFLSLILFLSIFINSFLIRLGNTIFIVIGNYLLACYLPVTVIQSTICNKNCQKWNLRWFVTV